MIITDSDWHIHLRRHQGPLVYLLPISPLSPAVSLYETNLDSLTSALSSQNIPWNVIELFNASADCTSSKSTLIIGLVKPAKAVKLRNTDRIAGEYASKLGVAHITIATDIVYYSGSTPTASSGVLRLGAPIFAVGSSSYGTLGGFMSLRDTVYASTCQHVVCEESDTEAALKICAPPWSEHIYYRRYLSQKLERLNSAMQPYLLNCSMRGKDPAPSRMDPFNKEVESLERAIASDADVVGTVALHSSTHNTEWHARQTRADWCLVELAGTQAKQMSRNTATYAGRRKVSIKAFHDGGDLCRSAPKVWTGDGSRGGLGRVNGAISRVCFNASSEGIRSYSDELAVVSEDEGESFALMDGDSGTWVLGRMGELVGVVLGGNNGTKCTYISDANMIRVGILKATGEEPVLAVGKKV